MADQFDSLTVAEWSFGAGETKRVSLQFDRSDLSKPFSISFSDTNGSIVSVPAELWAFVTERIESEWQQ